MLYGAFCRLQTKGSLFLVVLGVPLCLAAPLAVHTLTAHGLFRRPDPVVHARFYVEGERKAWKNDKLHAPKYRDDVVLDTSWRLFCYFIPSEIAKRLIVFGTVYKAATYS